MESQTMFVHTRNNQLESWMNRLDPFAGKRSPELDAELAGWESLIEMERR
jgi:hypothetical protein